MRVPRHSFVGLVIGIVIASIGIWAAVTHFRHPANHSLSPPPAQIGAAAINALLLISVMVALVFQVRHGYPLRRTDVKWISEDEYRFGHRYRIGPLHHLSGRALLIRAKTIAPSAAGPFSFRLRTPSRDLFSLSVNFTNLIGTIIDEDEKVAIMASCVNWDASDDRRNDLADIEIPVPMLPPDNGLFLVLSLERKGAKSRSDQEVSEEWVRIRLQFEVAEKLVNRSMSSPEFQEAHCVDVGVIR